MLGTAGFRLLPAGTGLLLAGAAFRAASHRAPGPAADKVRALPARATSAMTPLDPRVETAETEDRWPA